MYMDLLAGALVLFLTYMLIQNKKDPKKLFGVYSQPGKWYFLKYPVILALMCLRRVKYYIGGKAALFDVKQLEQRQQLSDDPLAFDAVFFHAVSQEGIFLAAGSERRHGGVVNGLVYLEHPEYGLLKSEKLPDTKLVADPESLLAAKEWAAEGIKFTPVEPMKRWDFSYDGKMRLHDKPEKLIDVKIQAKFTSDLPWFLYEMELPLKMLARSIARESWSEELFTSLKSKPNCFSVMIWEEYSILTLVNGYCKKNWEWKDLLQSLQSRAHQVHYEQMGFLEGTLKIEGKELPLKLDAFRDHSFGFKRDWKLMHRYIFQMFYLENQTRIVLGVVSQPCTGSHYEMGYVVHANGKLDAIDTCDLLLWQHGESGRPSDELCFTFMAGDHTYECKVKYTRTASHFVGNNTEVKMYERFLTCTINGVKGKGISEWNYSNTNGKFNLNQYQC